MKLSTLLWRLNYQWAQVILDKSSLKTTKVLDGDSTPSEVLFINALQSLPEIPTDDDTLIACEAMKLVQAKAYMPGIIIWQALDLYRKIVDYEREPDDARLNICADAVEQLHHTRNQMARSEFILYYLGLIQLHSPQIYGKTPVVSAEFDKLCVTLGTQSIYAAMQSMNYPFLREIVYDFFINEQVGRANQAPNLRALSAAYLLYILGRAPEDPAHAYYAVLLEDYPWLATEDFSSVTEAINTAEKLNELALAKQQVEQHMIQKEQVTDKKAQYKAGTIHYLSNLSVYMRQHISQSLAHKQTLTEDEQAIKEILSSIGNLEIESLRDFKNRKCAIVYPFFAIQELITAVTEDNNYYRDKSYKSLIKICESQRDPFCYLTLGIFQVSLYKNEQIIFLGLENIFKSAVKEPYAAVSALYAYALEARKEQQAERALLSCQTIAAICHWFKHRWEPELYEEIETYIRQSSEELALLRECTRQAPFRHAQTLAVLHFKLPIEEIVQRLKDNKSVFQTIMDLPRYYIEEQDAIKHLPEQPTQPPVDASKEAAPKQVLSPLPDIAATVSRRKKKTTPKKPKSKKRVSPALSPQRVYSRDENALLETVDRSNPESSDKLIIGKNIILAFDEAPAETYSTSELEPNPMNRLRSDSLEVEAPSTPAVAVDSPELTSHSQVFDFQNSSPSAHSARERYHTTPSPVLSTSPRSNDTPSPPPSASAADSPINNASSSFANSDGLANEELARLPDAETERQSPTHADTISQVPPFTPLVERFALTTITEVSDEDVTPPQTQDRNTTAAQPGFFTPLYTGLTSHTMTTVPSFGWIERRGFFHKQFELALLALSSFQAPSAHQGINHQTMFLEIALRHAEEGFKSVAPLCLEFPSEFRAPDMTDQLLLFASIAGFIASQSLNFLSQLELQFRQQAPLDCSPHNFALQTLAHVQSTLERAQQLQTALANMAAVHHLVPDIDSAQATARLNTQAAL